jgi:hypothetical protein
LGERLGLIPDDLADLDAVTKRMRDEAAGAQALAVMPSVICAWARGVASSLRNLSCGQRAMATRFILACIALNM